MDWLPATQSEMDRLPATGCADRTQRAPRTASTKREALQKLELLMDAWPPRHQPHQLDKPIPPQKPRSDCNKRNIMGGNPKNAGSMILPSQAGRAGATGSTFMPRMAQPWAANTMVQWRRCSQFSLCSNNGSSTSGSNR